MTSASSTAALKRMPLQQQQQTNLQDLERRASKIVLAIEKCMGLTRDIEEFNKIAPAALWSSANNKKGMPVGTTTTSSAVTSRQPGDPKRVIESFDLLAHLEAKGLGADALEKLCGATTQSSKRSSNSNSNSTDKNPRRRIVQGILQPLAETLCDCYAQLDRIPAPVPSPTAPSNNTSKKKQPPPPPPGMLSLQNYTDIGAFLEFWVCMSVLPLLEPCILFPVEDRARYFLPKSLAGRLSRPSLLWGCRQEVLFSIEPGRESEALQDVARELQSTVVILGHVLLLDRFRPMLLPRHLSDMYAAIFQTEVYTKRLLELLTQQQQEGSVDTKLSQEYQEIVTLLLPPSTTISESNTKPANKSSLAPVNPALQAQSLQTLLLQGIKAPLWLRQRVATRLTDLASHNLSVIIQVFVHAAPPKDKTAASLRLAHTLVTSSNGHTASSSNIGNERNHYFDCLCGQVVQIVDDITNECHQGNLTCGNIEHLTLKQRLDLHTLWAILDQIPVRHMQSRMLSELSKGLLQDTKYGSICIHKSVNRIAILTTAIPPSFNPSKLVEVLMKPLEVSLDSPLGGGAKSTILGQLVRLAALSPTVIKSAFRDDVVLTLGLVVQVILGSTFSSTSNGSGTGTLDVPVDETEVAAMALLYTVAPSEWDITGNSYILKPEINAYQGFVGVRISYQGQGLVKTSEDLITAVERRVKVILEDILSPIIQASSSSSNKNDDNTTVAQRKADALPSVVFHLVLRSYFVGASPNVSMPHVFQQSSGTSSTDMFRIVAMCCLPLLCESCPIDYLLKSSESDATGIFGMIQLVFACAGAYFTSDNMIFSKPDEEVSTEATVAEPPGGYNAHSSFYCSGQYFSALLEATMKTTGNSSKHESSKAAGEVDTSLLNVELLLSVTTLLLSLLIALIELGSRATRTSKEELTLGSFITLLLPLAELSDNSWMPNGKTDESIASASAELAEMAGHAMALLAARKAPSQHLNDDTDMITSESIATKGEVEKVLQQARMDLTSTQPPIRARGIVSLQRFLRGDFFLKLLSKDAVPATKSSLIVEIDESGETSPTQLVSSYAIHGILQCAISALSDSESYVYLAAVQSIVAAADTCPRKVLPSIALAVVSGDFRAQVGECNDTTAKDKLSSAQQVKLSEALIFCIRRRANLDEFAALLLDLMLFGDKEVGKEDSTEIQSDYDIVLLMHKETQRYFLQGSSEESSQDEDFEEKMERQNVRFNTGGPVFDTEERDVVTAGRIAVISELLSMAHPSTLAKYCHILVRAATETLRLDASRPVRRAAAFLAREFYQCILKEQAELFEMIGSSVAMNNSNNNNNNSETDLALTSALISSSRDEVLASTLARCLAGDDLKDLSREKHRLFDSATTARCQEALDARKQAIDGGVFNVAKLLVEAKRQRKNQPAAKLILDLLKPGIQDETAVEALRSLKVNFDTLELS